MKLMFLTTLLMSSAIIVSAGSSPQSLRENDLLDKPPAIARRAMKPMFDSPDPDCTVCNDASFLFAAQDAMDTCPGQLTILQSRVDSATTDANVDQAWNFFCTGSCLKYILQIDDEHTCCMGDYADTAMNIRLACSRSSASRYCGAEVNNLKKFNCTQTTSETCIAQSTCQWDAAANSCYFSGDATTIASACSECNRQYFVNYPGGGIFTPEDHAKYAATYATFCTRINGTTNYAQSAGVGFRLAADLSASDVNNRVCAANSHDVRKAKMALRSNSVRVAESIRRNAMSKWSTCAAGTETCAQLLQSEFNKAEAIDTAASRLCHSDGSGAFCAARAATILSSGTNRCMLSTLADGTCAEGCAQTSSNALNSLGCCAATYGTGGFWVSKANVSSVAHSQKGLGTDVYNRSAPAQGRTILTNEAYNAHRNTAKSFVAADGFNGVRSCAGSQDGLGVCPVSAVSRSYEFTLALSYNVMNTAAGSKYIINALTVDIASAIGISAAQISFVSLSASSTDSVRILGVNYPATVVTVSFSADSDADNMETDDAVSSIHRGNTPFVFPVFGPEVSLSYPTALQNGYTSFFVSAFAKRNDGDSPLSSQAAADLGLRNTSPPTSGNGASTVGSLATVSFVLASAVLGMLLIH